MARPVRCPHTPYYGTVDATPLWLMLLDEYHRWTADDGWSSARGRTRRARARLDRRAAMSTATALSRTGAHRREGLDNQGWKDRPRRRALPRRPPGASRRSRWSRCRATSVAAGADGAHWPSCACDARPRSRGSTPRRRSCARAFEEAFWMEDSGTTPSRSMATGGRWTASTSNPGHLLFAGVASPERAGARSRVLTRATAVERLGRFARWRPAAVLQPARYHTAPSGRTTTRSARSESRRYGSDRPAARMLDGLYRRRSISGTGGCPSCSAASAAARAISRATTRWRARRRRGRPAPSS